MKNLLATGAGQCHGNDSVRSFHNESDTESVTGGTHVSSESEEVIGQQETKVVGRLRAIVLVVLAAAAAVVALTVYRYLSFNEEQQFHQQFRDEADKIIDSFGKALDRSLASFDCVAIMLVSTAHMTNQTWPFVTIDDFAARLSKVLPSTRADVLSVLHLVTPEQRGEFEDYVTRNDYWVEQGLEAQAMAGGAESTPLGVQNPILHGPHGNVPRSERWQAFPCTSEMSYSWDALTLLNNEPYLRTMKNHKAVLREPYMVASPHDTAQVQQDLDRAEYFGTFLGPNEVSTEPVSDFLFPVINSVHGILTGGAADYNPADFELVGILSASVYWRSFLLDILPEGSEGIHLVFENPCSSNAFTYVIKGPKVEYMGVGDHHEHQYTSSRKTRLLHSLASNSSKANAVHTGSPLDAEYCPMTLHLYPSREMKQRFTTHNPTMFMVAVVAIFSFVSVVFVVYDAMVERRQSTVMSSAVRSSAIVSSLFPSEVRNRLYPMPETTGLCGPDTVKGKLSSFLREHRSSVVPNHTLAGGLTRENPIADLYPDTTVLFADISGFTAWSSERSPTQVFVMLETVYGAFDAIAKQRGVFKVETIGDCYVAVVGLPTPRRNHAAVMALFARDCREKMADLVEQMANTLGPGTADLAMRFGMNSGPTTAGVLRGEKSRFQLFGDTVNTAARMESNGLRNKIQVSQKTADQLRAAGKGHWLTEREEKVDCKGKGMMTTFWCEPPMLSTGASSNTSLDQTGLDGEDPTKVDESCTHRLVDWNVAMFTELLGEVMSSRIVGKQGHVEDVAHKVPTKSPIQHGLEDVSLLKPSRHVVDATVSSVVWSQLRDLIGSIANGYNNNRFHDFEHASHVVMSTKKLLDRIAIAEHEKGVPNGSKSVGHCTYGITANPLHKMAILFAALIHDLDHSGVSNAQLVAEKDPLAVVYDGQSVAEQNSVDVAWKLLMQPKFAALRKCIFPTEAEFTVFRQVVAHAVIATDLFDKDLKAARESRWAKSFAPTGSETARPAMDQMSRRATIVIELIIQASDVSHTMQHFTVYKKWNMKLLSEMYSAYRNGRMSKDPTEGWYEGELWFFDNYVIPLARKLRECQVFGVSCDEFLDYANDNRTEWEIKGREIVQEAKVTLERAASLEQVASNSTDTGATAKKSVQGMRFL